jgi:hypothetical protein
MKRAVAVLLLTSGLLLAQTTSVFIYDSNGNQTTGTIRNGNVYFQDSRGNSAFGTIRDGNVFLTTGKGELTFGTIRDGNVFLIDGQGVTTGTIRNGNIFLNNSDGSTTTGTYRDQNVWSYRGSASCYHSGTAVQCLEAATLQRYVSSREQFQAQFQAGYVAGEVIGALIRAWIEHRHKIDLERKNIRQQISAYYQATFELNDEVMQGQDALVAAYTRLAQLDPSRRSIYEQGAKDSTAFRSRLAMFRPTSEKNLPKIVAAKDLKYLQENLELAKKFYSLTLDGGKREFVYSELMRGLVGYYENQQNASPR